MKLLQQCILLSSSVAAVVASGTDVNANVNVNVDRNANANADSNVSLLERSRLSPLSSSSSSLSSSSSVEIPFVKQHEAHEHIEHEHIEHEPQFIHSYTNNKSNSDGNSDANSNSNNEYQSIGSRRDLREWIHDNRTPIQFSDEIYKYFNVNTYRGDYVSSEVQLSTDGRRLAIRGTSDQTKPDYFYAVYKIVVRDIDTDWMYQTVSTNTTTVLYGTSISISSDSNEIAVGSNSCNDNVQNFFSGAMCVYYGKNDNNSPDNPETGPVDELYKDDTSLVSSWGKSVSLTNDGVYIAVGSSHGMVYVYRVPMMVMLKPVGGASLSSVKKGDPIVVDPSGVSSGSTFGEIVKMAGNEAAKTVAVGGVKSGRVAVYQFLEVTKKWTKIGNDITTADGDEFEISDNGKIVAVKYSVELSGSITRREVRVYELRTTSNGSKIWSRMGSNTIMVEYDKTPSLSISSSGKILAVGAFKGAQKNSQTAPGYVKLFEYVSSRNRWVPMALPLVDPDGKNSMVDFGRSVSLSGNGMTLAVAAPAYDATVEKQVGYVKVYELSAPFPSAAPSISPSSKPSKPPTRRPTRSPAPSNDPATAPSATPSSRPSTSEPSPSPSANPTSSFSPSMSPSVSHSPTILTTNDPTTSTCTSNCDCSSNDNPFCTLAFCTSNCNCDEGGCDLSACEEDCRCKGGSCNMRQCQSNCQCQGRNCQMDNCIYNGRCNPNPNSISGGSSLFEEARKNSVVVTVGLMIVGLVAMGAF